jgi:quercetin dioxygenase-like cupin family protein/ketosteroid isomerase-like protein
MRLSLAIWAGAVALAVPAAAQDTGVVRSSTWSWADIEPQGPADKPAAKSVVRRPTLTLDELEMHVTRLPPGQTTHAPHTHPNEELIIVREGTVEAYQEGRKTRLGPGSIIFEASNESHNVTNVGDGPAVYHVINWKSAATKPKPVADAAASERAIRALYGEWARTAFAGGEDGSASGLAADAVLMPPDAPPVLGRAAIRSWQDRSSREDRFRVVVDAVEHDEIRIAGDTAFCRTTLHGRRVPKAGGPAEAYEAKYFDMLRRGADGRWEPTHRMWSRNRPLEAPPAKTAESR